MRRGGQLVPVVLDLRAHRLRSEDVWGCVRGVELERQQLVGHLPCLSRPLEVLQPHGRLFDLRRIARRVLLDLESLLHFLHGEERRVDR